MIAYFSETDFALDFEDKTTNWISSVLSQEKFKEGEISYIFCDDDYLLNINVKYLKHNTLTDIVSFDYTNDKLVSGDIFISIDRVKENATTFNVSFFDEMSRVLIHGILHFCGYNDKTTCDKALMRSKEDYYLSLRAF